jgi:hypothetical protein
MPIATGAFYTHGGCNNFGPATQGLHWEGSMATNYIIDTEVKNVVSTMTGFLDTLVVTNSGSIINPNSVGIDSKADEQDITIDGLVSAFNGVQLGGNQTRIIVNGDLQG